MPLPVALLYFGIPALLITLNIQFIMPLFARRGLGIFWNYMIVYAAVPMLLLIMASVVVYRLEGHPLQWAAFRVRMRLGNMTRRGWLWALGLLLFMFISVGVLRFTAGLLVELPLFSPAPHWPAELNPATPRPEAGTIPTELMGQTLLGNWPLLVTFLVVWVIATLGEELWWRGIVLPRQELAHGRNTWVVHGVLWTLFHIFTPWNLLVLLPGALALSYIAQRTRSTIPGIVAHALVNGLEILLLIVVGVLGVGA